MTATEYMCTNFGVDSSSRFPFRPRTNRQTDKQKQTDKQTDATVHTLYVYTLRYVGLVIPCS